MHAFLFCRTLGGELPIRCFRLFINLSYNVERVTKLIIGIPFSRLFPKYCLLFVNELVIFCQIYMPLIQYLEYLMFFSLLEATFGENVFV